MNYEEVKDIWNSINIINEFIEIDMDDEIAIMKYSAGESFKIMNSFGNVIWNKLKEKSPFDEFIKYVENLYNIDKAVFMNDLGVFLNYLVSEELVKLNNSTNKCVIKESTNMEHSVGSGDNYEKVFQYYLNKEKPFKVFLELTYNCNLRCKHCYLGNETDTNNEKLSYSKVTSLIDELSNAGVVDLVLTGGEVGTRKDFIDIVKYAISKKMMITILTNATLFDDNLCDELIKLNIYDLRVSIYGPKEYHDSFVKREGSYEKSMKVLKRMNNEKGIGTAVFIVTSESYKYVDEMEETFKKNNIQYTTSTFIFPTIYGDKNPTKYRVNKDQLRECFKKSKKKFGGNLCTAGVSKFRITPNGDVNPCEMLRNISFGNINKLSFKEIMDSKERKEWIKKFKEIIENRKCNSCKLKSYCSNCLGVAYLETNDYYGTPEYSCNTAAIQYEVKGVVE